MGDETKDLEQRLKIEGMHCAGCAHAVRKALLDVPGVRSASINLLSEQAAVTHSQDVSAEKLQAAIEAAGYKATPVDRSRRIVLPIEGMAPLQRRDIPKGRDRTPKQQPRI